MQMIVSGVHIALVCGLLLLALALELSAAPGSDPGPAAGPALGAPGAAAAP